MSERPPLWRPSESRPSGPAPTAPHRRRQIYVALAVLAALLGATAAWLLFLSEPPRPAFLGIWIDEYNESRVPVNAWAERDRQALESLPWQSTRAFSSQQGNLLREALGKFRDRTEGPIVVFLCAHAAVRSDGAVCVLPGNATLEDESTWLPLTVVGDILKGCRSKHKLLILDLMRPFTDPRLGLLGEDLTGRVQALLQNAVRDDKDLQVLWACAPGEHSLTSEDLGHSAFAYYLREGLRGAADGCTADGKAGVRNGRVTVRELARFVQARVGRWAAGTRGTRQTPQFLTTGEDFALLGPADQANPPTPGADPAYPKWLLAGWQKRDAWWGERPVRVAPALLRQLENALLRAEHNLAAGIASGQVETELADKLKQLEEEREKKQAGRPAPGKPSLARAALAGTPPPDFTAVAPQYRDLLVRAAKVLAAAKPSEKDLERLETEKAALLKRFDGKPPSDPAWLVLHEAMRDLQPRQDRLRFATRLLEAVAQVPAYEETEFVKRLAEWKVDEKDWPAPAVRVALQLARKAAAAEAVADDTRLLPWVRHRLKAARASRQAAERLLFNADGADAGAVTAALEGARGEYEVVGAHLRLLAEAYRAHADALVRLPSYAPYLDTRRDADGLWEQVVRAACDLLDRLATPPPGGAVAAGTVRKLGELTETLREGMKELLGAQVEAPARVLIGKRDKAGPADWLSMQALLRSPWLDAGDRAKLWTAAHKVSARLTAEVLKQDRQDDAAERQTPAPPPVDLAAGAARERDLALRRARVSVALLQVEGVPTLKGVRDALAEVERDRDRPAAWRALGLQLREAWAALAAARRAAAGREGVP